MWESWLVLSLPFAIWSGVAAARFLGRRLALWRLKRLTHHRSRLELAWDLLRTIPRECLTTELRKAAGKMLRHHLAACANGKARRSHELRIARFVGGSTPLTWDASSADTAAQALRQLIELLTESQEQGVITVAEHVRAHYPLTDMLTILDEARAARSARVEQLLTLPFARTTPART